MIPSRSLGASSKKVAVLEFRNEAGFTDFEMDSITDFVRGVAIKSLPSSGFMVMTRESLVELLPPGKDLTDCRGACEVEAGRNLGADYVVSGEVGRFGETLHAKMKLFDTATSALLSQEVAKAEAVGGLEGAIKAAAPALFRAIHAGALPEKAQARPAPVEVTAGRTVREPKRSPTKASEKDLGIEMVEISEGTFTMGSPPWEEGRFDDERQHDVVMSRPFLVAKYEVTEGLWRRVMGIGPRGGAQGGDAYPVVQVSWYEAIELCNRLSEKVGLIPAYRVRGRDVAWDRSADGYRLPTEAEWELACRAGTTTRFCTGNQESSLARAGWYRGNTASTIQPVGRTAPSPWGLFDMHGNVWEWCWDGYAEEYPTAMVTDPSGPASATSRVYRGGGCDAFARYCRSAYRNRSKPDRRLDSLGFRLFRSR